MWGGKEMFKVIRKHPTSTEVIEVYAVDKDRAGYVIFLVFSWGEWGWTRANEYIPYKGVE